MTETTTERLLRRYGGELLTLMILIPLVVVLVFLLSRSSLPQPTDNGTPTPAMTAISDPPTPTTSPDALTVADSTPTSAATATVTLVVVGRDTSATYHIPALSTVTVAEVLRVAQEQGLQAETKDYGGSLGLFVESLNGVANDPVKQLYWQLYINEQRSPVGASIAQVNPGDSIRWVLEKEHNEN